MTPKALAWCLVALLPGAALPAMAQDAMAGMPMPPAHHAAKPSVGKHKSTPKPAAGKSTHDDHDSMDSMPGMDMSGMGMSDAQPATTSTPTVHSAHAAAHMDAHPETPVHLPAAPPGPRSPDYSDGIGYDAAMVHMGMDDDKPLGKLLFDRLEFVDARDANGAAFDAQAWYGNDANKLWLKAEGETTSGRLQDLRVEALWDRAVSPFWDAQLGVRHDAGAGPDRNWLAIGVQGLAPYWFDVSATFYVGPSGRTALRFESEYELLLTQRLVLEPRFEANLYGRSDPQRGIGSGLSDAALGLRLRYEFTRQFAPYVGIEFARRFGGSADMARAVGEPAFDPRVVAGLRFWF